MKKLRVGVIGCGRISFRHLLPLTSIEEVELVACCDIKPERADEAAKTYGIKAYYSYEDMINSEELDAVHLCLPHYLHSKVAIYAFEHGRQGDLFVQKAPAATIGTLAKAVCKYMDAEENIKLIGTRHGEKLYEVLVTKEEMVIRAE